MSRTLERGVAGARATQFPLPAPLRHARFRRLWVGMATSYAGDRLQQLAQGWLVAVLTGSALGVGLVTALGTLPLLLLPLGGVLAERVDRRRLLILAQLIGGVATAAMTLLVVSHRVAVWHVYAWAGLGGVIWLAARPAYKVALTESVPAESVRAAVALNSTTETSAQVLVNAVGSLLLGAVGLPIAFALNAASYLLAAACLRSLPAERSAPARSPIHLRALLADVADGWRCVARAPALLRPLLLTLLTVVAIGPLVGVLPAIVHARGGSIVDLGLLAGALSAGSLGGAVYAGARDEGGRPARRYALFGFLAAAALALFAGLPLGALSAPPLAVIGFLLFAEAVWNTSRVRALAAPAYQARVQAFTTMASTLGLALATLWAGAAIDRFGLGALLYGAAALALGCAAYLAVERDAPLRVATGAE